MPTRNLARSRTQGKKTKKNRAYLQPPSSLGFHFDYTHDMRENVYDPERVKAYWDARIKTMCEMFQTFWTPTTERHRTVDKRKGKVRWRVPETSVSVAGGRSLDTSRMTYVGETAVVQDQDWWGRYDDDEMRDDGSVR